MITLQERVHAATKPDDWQLDKLHHVFRVRRGNKNTGMKEDNLLSLSYGRIIQKDIETADGLLPENFEGYQIVEPGNIVLRLTDLQNDKRSLRQGLATQRGIITSAYDAVEVLRDNDPRFWFYSLLALDLAKHYYSLGGGVRQSVKFADFPNDWVYRPDLATQRRIADFLDRETARIDLLIEKKQRLVALWNERIDAEVSSIVFQTNRPERDLVETGVDWLGRIPSSWQLSRVGWELERITYGFTNPMPTEDEGPFLLTANDVNYGRILWKTARHTSQHAFDHDLTDKSRPKVGDVLLTKDGTLGRVAIHDGRPACINQSVALIRPRKDRVKCEFLANVLLSRHYQDRMMFEAGGTTIKHIYITRLQKMPLPVPSMGEQREINARIEATRERVMLLGEKINASIDRLKEYRSALISAAVTGQIDVDTYAKSGTPDRHLDAIQEEMGA